MGKKDFPKMKIQEWKSDLFFFQKTYIWGKLFAVWLSVDRSQIPTEATAVEIPQTRCLY